MRIMGLDVGERTIGVAISDEFGWTAQGVEVIRRKKLEDDLTRIEEIIQQRTVEEIGQANGRAFKGERSGEDHDDSSYSLTL